MGDRNNDQSIMDKSMRSVFVGNIPYEATEEELIDIFNEVGHVLSLKLVYDRESGKPKGYGFCEYKDQETALSAMRNLSGYEIAGRRLRVDNACTEKSRMEMQQLLQVPQVENPYGDQCEPENAPEVITKTVASLPPEQMYELMKQMKTCIQTNPSEARQMLLQNPQLAYALLQTQVVMRIVDTPTAVSMLHNANGLPPVLTPRTMQSDMATMNMMAGSAIPMPVPAPQLVAPVVLASNFPSIGQDIDLRGVIDPRMSRSMDQDMRNVGMPGPIMNPFDAVPQRNQQQHQQQQAPFQIDPRQRPVDPRAKQQQPPVVAQQMPAHQQSQQQQQILPGDIPSNASDQEKASLIMQVLQLTDEQIAMLPPEQRASILVLKEKIDKSTVTKTDVHRTFKHINGNK